MTLSPKLGINLLGDNDNVDPVVVSLNSGILDTAAPVILFSPAHSTDPSPTGRFDGDWRYNSSTQTLSRWNATKSEWQAIVLSDAWQDPFIMRPRLLATHTNTAASTVVGGGGVASVDLNNWSFSVAASGGAASGDYPNGAFIYVERGWFWWTGTPYPPSSKLYTASMFTNIGYKVTPSGTTQESITYNAIGPVGTAPTTLACIANNTFGYNSDKMGCKVPYVLMGQFNIQAKDAASSVNIFIRSVFQTDTSQFPNTMTAGRSADALGSCKAYIYQLN